MTADILIKNGLVVDPFTKEKSIRSLAIKNGLIAPCAEDTDGTLTVDASGCIISPGLIDFHGHFADTTSDLGANAEMICFPSGVTAYVDAGTTGVANYLGFRARTAASRLKAYALMHINPAGIATLRIHESQDNRYCDDEKMKQYFRLYGDQIKGLKIRVSEELLTGLGLKPLEHLRKLADEIGCPIVAHTTNAPCDIRRVLDILRPGDVYCHVFQGEGHTILDEKGQVYPEVYEAQSRGIIFDACNGKSNFGFNVAEPAIAQGFIPDVISSDMSSWNAYTPGWVFSLPFVMSKYLMFGLEMDTLLQCTVANPAKYLGQAEELGSLKTGTVANVAVQRIVDHKVRFCDAYGKERYGDKLIRTEMTICQGWTTYRSIELQ